MSDSTKWTNELLDEMRKQGDPMADKAAKALFEAVKGHSPAEVGAYISAFVSRDFSKAWPSTPLIQDPPELIAYFENFDDFMFNREEIEFLEKGADIFDKHGPWIVFALGVRSLLKQYAHTKAIEVLRLTTLLVAHVNRRIMETMQFVLDVMNEGWYTKAADGKIRLNLQHPGLMSIKKLRLLHAMIRYRLQNNMYDTSLGDYDIETLGYPINQEDMVFAVHTFSLEIIEGLREMRMVITDEEAENYFQCWKLFGRGLGVNRQLEPASYADAIELQNTIYQRHFTMPNSVGPVLAKALTGWFTSTVPLLDQKLLITFIKEFNGPENFAILSNNLDIDVGNVVLGDLRDHVQKDLEFEDKSGRPGLAHEDAGQMALDNFFIHFLRTLLTTERGGKNETFRIGDGFRASWNLNNMKDKPIAKDRVIWLVIRTLFNRILNKLSSLFRRSPKTA
ncbi:MAG TPA: oxygenase MpaB family protein [Saprospiraceae bacterium]|nr:oxygenase MpaB family protein [Saprospiraceae bacterium]